MKKIFYLFAITVFVFTSCNPLEDVISEVDAITENDALVDDLVFTLSDEDYEDLELSFGNFNSIDEAKEKIPTLLSANYPQLGVKYLPNGEIKEASTALVTYKLYSKKNDEKSLEVYTVTSADYSAGGWSYGNFSKSSDITTFLDGKYPNAANRLLVSLTYKYYSGSVSTLNNGFLNVNGSWEMALGITDDEYKAMGEGYSNFSSEDEALAKIPVFLLDKFKFNGKQEGDIESIMYKLYTGGSVKSFIANFIYDGSTWTEYDNVINETIKLGHNGTTWVPDNTIKYTLTPADYASVGNGQYNNFDLRPGKDEETVAQRLAKINTILKNNFPTSLEGQKYTVSYAYYDGSNGTGTLNVVLLGSDYVLQ